MVPDADRPALFRGPYGLLSSGLCLLVSLYAFEEMGVAAALPTAVRELNGFAYFGWAYTGFLAASVIGMSGVAYLSARYGPRRPILISVSLFVTGLVIAGAATNMTWLIGGRVVQGLSGGGLVSSVYILVGLVVPSELRPRLFAAISFCWVLPGVLGPTLSGAITEHVGWRWTFLGLAPVTAVAAALLIPAVSSAKPIQGGVETGAHQPERRPRRVLWAVVAASGVAAVQAGTQRPSAPSLVVAVIGAGTLVYAMKELLPHGTALARTPVGAPVAMRAVNAAALFGVEAVIPLMLATQHGFGPLASSIPLACAGLPCFLSSWWVGRLPVEAALGWRMMLARLGFSLVAVADASFIWLSRPDSPAWLMAPIWLLAGAGIGLVVPTANVLVLERSADRAADAAALPIADAVGACCATGFAGVMIAVVSRGTWSSTTAFAVIGITMTGVCLVGVVVAGRLGGRAACLDLSVLAI